jgi:hypothetical protein
MNDPFEQQLQEQELRPLPADWRSQVLHAAAQRSTARSEVLPLARLERRSWVQMLFWPCPKAWAGLAIAWLLIVGVNLVERMSKPGSREEFAGAAPVAVYVENRQLLTQLLTPTKPNPAQPAPGRRPRAEMLIILQRCEEQPFGRA